MPRAFLEADLLPLSALQHLLFCERQCALIHIEGVWAENRLTAEGRILHERVHDSPPTTRDGVRQVFGLRLRSLRLGLIGQADVVEFHPQEGAWRPFPVEHKRGKPKPTDCDRVQLCAQAMCLEEMLGGEITNAAIFYGQPRRREPVEFTPDLRTTTEAAALRLHEMIRLGKTPPAVYEKKCKACSLFEACRPQSAGRGKSARQYLEKTMKDL
ncbi:MAG: CRISPR-associated protein Cas4 [Kiritimatiellia bacterium]|nr:CRISPR-associated protein Cas4 [Kiritimatiellia bacterium]